MKATRSRYVLLVLAATLSTAWGEPLPLDDAQRQKQAEARKWSDPIAGSVLNRTITVMGRDFYQFFSVAWRDKDAAGRYSITVRERPTAIRGSELWVEYDGHRVFHAFLSPARSAVRQASRQAADIAYRNVMDIDVQRLMLRNIDLGAEEI